MLQIIFRETISLLGLIWRILDGIWLLFTAFWDWIQYILHSSLKVNPFWAQFGFFFASLFFSPFPWWTSFIFIFLPPVWSLSLLIFFYLLFIVFLSSEIVFL